MLQIPTWSKIVTALVVLFGILIALPNALPKDVTAKLPGFMPKSTVSLGLDLQGGSYLLLEVELDKVRKDRLETLVSDIRAGLRKARIGYTDLQTNGDQASVRILDSSRFDEARKILEGLNPAVANSVFSAGAHEYTLTSPGNGKLVMQMTDAYITQTQGDIVGQSIEVVRRRIDAMGTREPTIERQGEDRILVQVPGLENPERMKVILGKTAKMTFQLVDENASIPQAERGIVPIGDELLYEDSNVKGQPPEPIVVQKRVMVAGERLTNAGTRFDQRTNQPVVTFEFDSVARASSAMSPKRMSGAALPSCSTTR